MITIQTQFNNPDVDSAKLEHLIAGICGQFGLKDFAVNVQIVGDDAIAAANNQFLGHDYTTDVISFDMSDEGENSFDIIVNAALASRKADELGHSAMAELALYITHGLLHNLGFDDSNEEDAKKMHKKEDEILQAFGYGIVYNKTRNP